MTTRTYVQTAWVNETPESIPLRYRITDYTDTVIAEGAVIELLTAVTSGTPVNALNLNHMETGIYNAQITANEATTAAATAQSTANNGVSAASTAQTTANSALSAANAAQTAADLAAANAAVKVPLSAYTTKGDVIAATASGEITRVPAGSNGQALIYDSAQASGMRAGSITPAITITDLASEVSTSSTSWSDVLSVVVALSATGRIRARAVGVFRGSALYATPTIRLSIDGTDDTFEISFQINNATAPDQSWRQFATEWMRSALSSGNRTVKLQMKNGYAGGTIYVGKARLIIDVDYPA
jgi:hypothetical protein